ncbi:hypothetical protein ACFPN2_26360 [Steroidobacter flavus]|uniref:VCBS repeat-containing protein n=1 Tax=Steroidobacter flavus TaxID=1842136 RepID=A0ABV8SZN9_9GAMM
MAGKIQAFRRSGWLAAALALGAQATLVSSAVAQPDPRLALRSAGYTTYIGDIDHDGDIDVLVKAKTRFVMIDLEMAVPIVVKPSSPTFLLRAASGGYSIEVDPPRSITNDAAWTPGNFDLTFGDVTGTGAQTLLLRGRTAGATSFLITPSLSTGQPQLLQTLTPAALGVDLGGAASEVTLEDKDSDGQTDLVVRSNGTVIAVLIARDDGTFAKDTSSEAGPLMAWRVFCASLDDGNIEAALANIATSSRGQYQTALVNLGTAITGLTQNWVGIKTVEVAPTYAILSVTQSLGENLQYQVVMVKEDAQWRVDLF